MSKRPDQFAPDLVQAVRLVNSSRIARVFHIGDRALIQLVSYISSGTCQPPKDRYREILAVCHAAWPKRTLSQAELELAEMPEGNPS